MIGRHTNVLLPPAMERRVIRVRRHWAMLTRPILETLVVVGVGFGLSLLISRMGGQRFPLSWLVQSLLWYAAVAAVMRFTWKVLEWWLELIIVTDKRFMITSGVLETKNSMMPITKVTDMSFLRPFIGQILGYGTLKVESAGPKQDLQHIAYVPRPEEVFRAISELIFGEKKQTRSHMLEPPRGARRRAWRFARRSEPRER